MTLVTPSMTLVALLALPAREAPPPEAALADEVLAPLAQSLAGVLPSGDYALVLQSGTEHDPEHADETTRGCFELSGLATFLHVLDEEPRGRPVLTVPGGVRILGPIMTTERRSETISPRYCDCARCSGVPRVL